MKNLKNKYIGKYFIILTITILGIYSNYYIYNMMGNTVAYGTVLAKNDAMTAGKYPKQKFIISFKYDDNRLGTKDINVTFSSWAKLNKGDRTCFVVSKYMYDKNTFWSELTRIMLMICAIGFDLLISVFIVATICKLLEIIWNFKI